MKIAYLLGSLSRGGTETLLLDVFKNADKAEYDFIGVHRKDGPYKEDFCATKPAFYKLAPKFPFDICYFFKLRKLLKKEQITIVHAQQFLDSIYAKIACWGTKIKVVETFHGYDFGANKINKFLIKKSIDWCDAVLFVSNAQKEYYTKAYKIKNQNKLSVVYNGVNFDKLGKLEKKSSSQNVLKFGMVGNFVRGREQNSIVKFLKLLKDKNVPFEFYFVGAKNASEPWRYDDCVRFCQENELTECVHFLGSRNDVPQLLAEWDAFVYSTDHDTFGIAVIEAIAAGLPTFVNDWEVMEEVTNHGKWATLYATKNPADLLENFCNFVNDKDTYFKRAYDNAKQVREMYSIEQHINRSYTQYKEI